jgi:hypothetical protein
VKNSNLPPLTKLPSSFDWHTIECEKNLESVRTSRGVKATVCHGAHPIKLNFNCKLNRAHQCLFPLVNMGGTTVQDSSLSSGEKRRDANPAKGSKPTNEKVSVLSPYPLPSGFWILGVIHITKTSGPTRSSIMCVS